MQTRSRSPSRSPFFGFLAAGALGGFCLSALSCKKDTESLVVVALTAAPADTTLTSVSITAASVTQTFTLLAGKGLSSTATTFGVYLPSSITGQIDVEAKASGSGGGCAGYVGYDAVLVISGGTSGVNMALQPGNICGHSPPSLANCTEYDHRANPSTCVTGDPATDVEMTDVAFTPNGTLLFTAGEDSRVKIWTWDGANLTPEGHELATTGGFTELAVSPDGKLVAAGSMAGSLTVWNVEPTWSVAANLTGITGDLTGVTFSPNSQILYAVDSDGYLTTYTTTSLAPASTLLLRNATTPFSLAASPTESDGSYWLGVGYGNGDGGLIHVVGGALGAEIPFTVSSNNLGGVYTMKFSPNGTLLESGAQDGSFEIWSVPLPTPAAPHPPPIALTTDFVFGAAFHPSNTLIAIGAGATDGDRQLGIWTVATGALRSAVSNTTLSHRPTAVAFSSDGTTLVAGEHSCGKIIVCAD